MSDGDRQRSSPQAGPAAGGDDPARMEGRLILILIGGFAGLSLWLFLERLDDLIANRRLYLFLFAAAVGLFVPLLALTPPLGLRRALARAAIVAFPAAALLTWASLRFDDIGAFLGTGHPVLAFAILILLPLPFLIAQARPDEGWHCYRALFLHAWNMFMHFAAGLVFVGIFWGLILLANALFGLVGLELIEDLLNIGPVPFVLTGGVFGLALGVVAEHAGQGPPSLALRLLRLFLPVVLVVVVVFVIALPVKGIDGIFGGFSVAATLLAMALASITLVTLVAERDESAAVPPGLMRLAARALALLLPVLAVLAVVAIAQRVRQYGWTPDRLAAATLAAIVLLHAAAYALAAVRGRGWMARIRHINITLAFLTLAIAALWLTPLLDPQRISTESQLARLEGGRTDAGMLDILTMHNAWGRAGKAGTERLKAMRDHPQHDVLMARIGDFEKKNWMRRRDSFGGALPPHEGEKTLERIAARLPVRPEGDFDPLPVLEAMDEIGLRLLDAACAGETPGGHPACVLVHGDFLPARPGEEVIVLAPGIIFLEAGFRKAEEKYEFAEMTFLGDGPRPDNREIEALIDSIHEGDFALTPLDMRGLDVNGRILIINP